MVLLRDPKHPWISNNFQVGLHLKITRTFSTSSAHLTKEYSEKIQRRTTLELDNPATGGLLTAPSLPKYSSKDDTYLPTKDEVVGEKKRKRTRVIKIDFQ
ncbi:unnamed protein product [Allacma fusca]|uniref:Uncharacterized protein n=1 Tax=Allacma fusca TaxID=39272 RepID=A0A8J2PMI5_9HEXA|nr:unnamed protein product [Allacma fusca]